MINVTRTFLPPLSEFSKHLERVWETKWATNRGELVRELESKLGEYLGVTNILAVNNGTIALQIAIKALELKGEIVVTPFSYVATVSSVVWENCTPVFVDIDPEFLTIDETKIEAAITENTVAILATHVFGNPCNVEAIEDIANRHRLKVIYDAAHCFGVKYKGESILNWGDISTLSFHATKLFHTGEGGGVVCRDEKVAEKVFNCHNFGHDGPEAFFGLGINGKMSELNAAMGLSVLPYMDEIMGSRKAVCEAYENAFNGTRLERIKLRAGTGWNYSYYPVVFPNEASLIKTKDKMNKTDIFPRRYFYPSLNYLPYVQYSDMPVAEDISRTILCLPLADDLSLNEVDLICSIVTRVID